MKFSRFTDILQSLENTSSRLEITDILAALLGDLQQNEIKQATYLLTGSVAASYEGVVFNIADKMVIRAIADAYSLDTDLVQSEYKKVGDLGDIAAQLHKGSSKDHSITQVFDVLIVLTGESGEGSQDRRIKQLSDLLKNVSALEAKYIVRIITSNLRLGFSDKTLIDALSVMETKGKTLSRALTKVYEVIPDIGELAYQAKVQGIEKMSKHPRPVVGIPVQPMLSQRLKSPTEMVKKMGEVAVEPKFDGLRVLIHYSKEKNMVKAFTRNLKDISTMFPELLEIGKHLHADEIILDSEAVGMDPTLVKIADFQTTMHRRRKNDIADIQSKIPVTFQVFDIVYKDGESYMETPYTKRREVLKKTVKNGSLLLVDTYTITSDPALITSLHKQYRAQGLEGVIVKKADSEYVPGRLGWRWVKMKESEEAIGKLSDTVDAVIMGYTMGQGKRASFGIGQFLAGIVDGERILTVTKVGTGLTDAQFHELNAMLSKIKVEQMPKEYEVHKNLVPDFWVKPEVVVELAADDLTVSPNHTAGYALRFPRLVKVREDKKVNQATTKAEIKNLFDLQTK